MPVQLRLLCPPPRRFTPAAGITNSSFVPQPSFVKRQKVRGAKARGLSYQRKVGAYLQQLFGDRCKVGAWIRFYNSSGGHYCQPDAIITDHSRNQIIVVETKLKHTSDAWWQLRELYEPITKHLFGSKIWRFAVCEIVKWFDPSSSFPEAIHMLPDPTKARPDKFNVHICGRGL